VTLKSAIINDAFAQLRISGLTVSASPRDNEKALSRLEDMAAELEGRNVCIGYNFEEEPDPNSQIGTDKKFNQMLKTNLALRLASDFGKIAPQILLSQATQSLSSASSMVASENIRQVQPSRRSPSGSGNHRSSRYNLFQNPSELPPNQCATNKLLIGNTQDYIETFDTYLGGESIDSYEITSDSGLTIVSSSKTGTAINYRINAINNATQGAWQQVKITIMTDTARIVTRLISFEVGASTTVGTS
jgi:hypothetical protein